MTKLWHQKEHAKYPVVFHEIWSAGPHEYLCGDIETFDLTRWLAPKSVDVTFSDPPWNSGNAKMFRTQAEQPRDVDFERFLDAYCKQVVSVTRYDICIIMGTTTVELLAETMGNYGVQELHRWNKTYQAGNGAHPCVYWHGCRNPTDSLLPKKVSIEGTHGQDSTELLFRSLYLEQGIILDPCMGQGMVSRCGITFGHIVRGMELNPRRMAVTLDGASRYGYFVRKRGMIPHGEKASDTRQRQRAPNTN